MDLSVGAQCYRPRLLRPHLIPTSRTNPNTRNFVDTCKTDRDIEGLICLLTNAAMMDLERSFRMFDL